MKIRFHEERWIVEYRGDVYNVRSTHVMAGSSKLPEFAERTYVQYHKTGSGWQALPMGKWGPLKAVEWFYNKIRREEATHVDKDH